MDDVCKMCKRYADEELIASLQPVNLPDGQNVPHIQPRPKFKYIDGVQRLSDLPLPFLVDLPNGSSEGVFLTASRNAGCGLVPVLE